MSLRSTTHGGGAFPDTTWSMVGGLSASPAKRREALETLALRYWRPICLYLRQAMRVDREASKDLTQAFFAWLVEAPVFEQYDPARGAFRAFLKGVLRHYTLNQLTAERAQKRGGGRAFAQLKGLGLDELPDPQASDPERAFDLAWVQGVITRATERVERQLRDAGRADQFETFRAYDMAPGGAEPTYASVAAAQGLTVRAVRHHLTQTRARIRSEIRAELLDTVRSSAELDDEWRALFES